LLIKEKSVLQAPRVGQPLPVSVNKFLKNKKNLKLTATDTFFSYIKREVKNWAYLVGIRRAGMIL